MNVTIRKGEVVRTYRREVVAGDNGGKQRVQLHHVDFDLTNMSNSASWRMR